MSYFTPKIDATGYHYPSYQDILDDLISQVQAIYGSGIYLGSDSQDYQMISIFAQKIYDAYQAVELAYNSHSPVTAIGAALDDIVAINGIKRAQGTKSVATLTLSGIEGTVVTNGIVSDVAGVLWDLPETVTIGSGGTATAQATCRQTGVYTAAPNTITRIMTPTIGWVSVTNSASAVTGTFVEADSSLRARQATSVAMPSQTILTGLRGALLALDCVNQCIVYENDTNSTLVSPDPLAGLPAHSICCVVDYDTNAATVADDKVAIATTILNYKSCGCGTWGGTSQTVTDSMGQSYTIYFQGMSKSLESINITITPLDGYSQAYIEKIQLEVMNLLDTFTAGQTLTSAMISAVAMNANEDLSKPAFTVTGATIKQGASWVATKTFGYYVIPYATTSSILVSDGL